VTAYAPIVDGLAPGSATLVVLMGLTTRRAFADRLLQRGWSTATAAAIVSAAGQDGARAWTGRLDSLADAPVDEALPGTVVIGAVVGLSASIGGVVDIASDEPVRFERQSRG
jgi:uroporphyrin-III C-methyltransferase/precorrin-2 dehydrogenase/sirohydrochlorin ferrochelatase